MKIDAYAKVNLSLDVLGRFPNGYHEVQMIMQSVSLWDTLEILPKAEGITVKTNLPYLPTDERNLAHKAAKLFFEETGIKGGATIDIEKNIPVAAGLAGGSTDAAAVLRGLNALYEAGLSLEDLMAMGLKLGADVPYCLMGGTALSEGIGEKLTPLPEMPEAYLVLAKPSAHVSTQWVYETLDKSEIQKRPDTTSMLSALQEGDLTKLCRGMGNVLQAVTEKAVPEVSDYIRIFQKEGAISAMMSGSGPTVFGIFDREEKAKNAVEALKKLTKEVFLTKPVQ